MVFFSYEFMARKTIKFFPISFPGNFVAGEGSVWGSSKQIKTWWDICVPSDLIRYYLITFGWNIINIFNFCISFLQRTVCIWYLSLFISYLLSDCVSQSQGAVSSLVVFIKQKIRRKYRIHFKCEFIVL